MKIIISILASVWCTLSWAQETIVVYNAQGPSQSMTPQIVRVIEEANRIQSKYRFVMEFKPGGFESIAVKEALTRPKNHLVTITNAVIEARDRGFVNLNDLVPVFSHGDACWTVVTNFGSFDRAKELTVGGPAIGGATHLTALQIGRRYNIPVRYIVYRSNYDALLNMAADNHSVTFAMDRMINYQQLSEKNPKLQAVAYSCPERNPAWPNLKTLRELGVDAPYIWQFTMASKDMPAQTRQDIAKIFDQVYKKLGRQTMQAISDFYMPSVDTQTHYNNSINTLTKYRLKYTHEIQQ